MGVFVQNLHSELLLYVQYFCATIKNELQGPCLEKIKQ